MKPLSHISVLDLGVNVPGPFCSMTLGDLGARVVKVEPPGGDPLRQTDPGMFTALNCGKESIALDLKTQPGREALARLAEKADIVLEGSRPGVAARLGAGYAALSARNPRLVYCSISGFGQTGPWRDRPAHDLNYLALSGYLGVQEAIEGRPWPPPVLVSDLASGLYAAIMVLAALQGREVSGKGAFIDLSMTESALALLGPELTRATEGPYAERHPNVSGIPTYGLFRCGDGRWLSLGIVHEDHFWDRLCDAGGLPDLKSLPFADRMARRDEVRSRLEFAFLAASAAEWEKRLLEADVPAAAVVGLADVLDSPQFKARDAFVESGGHRYLAQPARFSTGSVAREGKPPTLGQHADMLLSSLGYSAAQIREMRSAGVVGRPEAIQSS
ncbi:MAG: CoA transferase [SAR202 cluster bacterium]|nr:CoA transferase [SAR202 cluster bacterium]